MVNRENAVAQPKRTYTGPLGAYIDGFVPLLLREGYKPRSVKKKFDLVMDLSRWMGRRKLSLVRLDDERQLRQFRISRQRRCRLRRADTWTLTNSSDICEISTAFLCARRKSIAPHWGNSQETSRAIYLSVERGLSQSTILDYPLIARRFLNDRFGNKPVRVKSLRLQDLHRFIMRHLKAGSPGQAKRVVNALRSFLRFLRQSLPATAPRRQVSATMRFCCSWLDLDCAPEK